MRSLFEYKRSGDALLAPLGRRRRPFRRIRRILADLPPAAAPVAVTVAGGLALVVVLGAILSRQADAPPPQVAETAAEAVAAPDAQQAEAEPVRAAALDTDMSVPSLPGSAAQATLSTETPEPAPMRLGGPARPDLDQTASIPRATIPPGAVEPPVPVAETEEELLALEAIQMREVDADLSEPSQEATAAIAPATGGPKRPAVTTKYVNMRAGPDDGADVMIVVPALAEIEAEDECNWCAVTYDGRAGFIYKSFISYRD